MIALFLQMKNIDMPRLSSNSSSPESSSWIVDTIDRIISPTKPI